MMNRRIDDPRGRASVAALMLICALLALTWCRVGLGQTPPQRPNIIMLLTDDQRWDTLGAAGHPIIQTPHLDRLAAEGVRFPQCFVTTAICMTSRASIFLGQYAARHHVWDFNTDFTPRQLAATYPAVLKRAGYHIGFIGKWGVGSPPEGLFHFDRAFPGQGRYVQQRGGRTVHLTQIMGDEALEFLGQAPTEQPFCLSISFKAPHRQDGPGVQFPFEPDLEPLYREAIIPRALLSEPGFFQNQPEFIRTSENRVRWKIDFATPEMYQDTVKSYFRLISGVDRVVGRMRAWLGEHLLADNTVILFS